MLTFFHIKFSTLDYFVFQFFTRLLDYFPLFTSIYMICKRLFSVIIRTLVGGRGSLTPLQICNWCILQHQPAGLSRRLSIKMIMRMSRILKIKLGKDKMLKIGNTLVKSRNPFIPQSYRSNSTTTHLLQGWLWH